MAYNTNKIAGVTLDEGIIGGLVGGQLISSILAVSCITVAFCSNFLMVQDKVNGTIKDLRISPVKPATLSISYYIATLISTLIVCFVAAGVCLGYVAAVGWYMHVSDILYLLLDILLLSFFGVFKLNIFKGSNHKVNTKNMGFFSAMLFGIIFSVSWTPCVGAFLGSALMLASQQGHVGEGVVMLLVYSLGLGIPFVLSAVLIDYLKSAFNWIKKHYKVINIVCGVLLILVGVLMATGLIGRMFTLLS